MFIPKLEIHISTIKPWETRACIASTHCWDETFRNGANYIWAFLHFPLCDESGQIAFYFPLSPSTSHLHLDITNRATLVNHNREQHFVLHTFQETIWTQDYTVQKISIFISIFNITMQTPGVCLLCECAWYSLSALFEVTRTHFHQPPMPWPDTSRMQQYISHCLILHTLLCECVWNSKSLLHFIGRGGACDCKRNNFIVILKTLFH